MQTRPTTQIARKSTRWLRGSPSFGYTRLFASAVPPTEQKKPEAVPPELGSTPSRPWKSSSTQAGSVTPTSTSPSSQFYVPSVVIPAEAAKSGPVHKIHILGEDVRSRFIAHALCSVYDSVETVPFREMPKSRYRNIEKVQPERTRKSAYVEKNAATPESDAVAQSDRSHIDELIVTGRGFEAVKAIASIKDRIDDKTSICLLNDGMGVLEQVREQLFNGTQPEPNFYLGHMSHALAFNRNRDSVKELRSGRTVFTKADPVLTAEKELYIPVEQQPSMMHSLRRVKELNTTFSNYEHWLRFKLPSVMFTAAVEPVCVLLDLSYQGLLENGNAQRMMNKLLGEMAIVTENMPEVQNSPDLIKFLRGEGLKKFCYRRITGKSKAPSDLLTRISKGLQTDINYQNGYFLKRARILGIDTPTNQLMVQMIKARRIEQNKKLRSFIPIQEASPNDLRKARLEQLKAEAGGSGGGSSSQEQQQQRQQQQNDARQHILNQILHPEAADRLGRIRLVKEERAADIENRLITLAQTGQLRQKVTEAQLKELLNAMSESKEEEKIVVSRRKAWDDDDDLDL
ncbi:hypothetical protein CEK26_009587 [Fusarium fujikuroi]|uniref:Uncharacterized protein n=1 Tax=Fusarium fujikuroi TaxID=5127 RepID=A0A5Q3DH14_FUSFU|nr:hypothetical protein CEK27_009608 [Fusarium fujikuroi]QGI96518.1 hypothetical protein CEK26_009587 [Fusarium fujikuroi]VTT60071.1 unnamed protein product [Fusarium fujikuroi]VTT78409.1 unnamed protein product [Fusarium fujikuroi]VZH88879.1 unnamed protein product [Fusarium fujikuroi]